MDHAAPGIQYIPAYAAFQKLEKCLSISENSACHKTFLAIKTFWYKDELYAICLLLGALLKARGEKDAEIQALEDIVSSLLSQLDANDCREIVNTVQNFHRQANTPFDIKELEHSMQMIQEHSLHNTYQNSIIHTQDTLKANPDILRAIYKNWSIAYEVLNIFGLYRYDVKHQPNHTDDTVCTFEAHGISPPVSPNAKIRKPRGPTRSRQNSGATTSISQVTHNASIESLQNTINVLRQEQASIVQQLKTTEAALTQTKRLLENKTMQYADVSTELEKVSTRELATNAELMQIQGQYNQLTKQAADKVAQNKTVTDKLSNLEQAQQTLRVQKKELQVQLNRYQRENTQLTAKKEELEKEVYTLWANHQQDATQSVREFSQKNDNYPTLIKLLKQYSREIDTLQQKHTKILEKRSTLDAQMTTKMHLIFTEEAKLEQIYTDIATLEDQQDSSTTSKTSLTALKKQQLEVEQALPKQKDERDHLQRILQTNNQEIAQSTGELQALRLAIKNLCAAVKQCEDIDSNTMAFLDSMEQDQIWISQEHCKFLAILNSTVAWATDHPYLTWPLLHKLCSQLENSYQQLINDQANPPTDQTFEKRIASLKMALNPANHEMPLISAQWSDVKIAPQEPKVAYRPYDFYQTKTPNSSLFLNQDVELKIKPLQENIVQLDLFYIGHKKVYIDIVKAAFLPLTQLIVEHTRSYRDLEVEIEINHHSADAKEIMTILEAYQTLYLQFGFNISIKNAHHVSDPKKVVETQNIIFPAHQEPLLGFHNLLYGQSINSLSPSTVCH